MVDSNGVQGVKPLHCRVCSDPLPVRAGRGSHREATGEQVIRRRWVLPLGDGWTVNWGAELSWAVEREWWVRMSSECGHCSDPLSVSAGRGRHREAVGPRAVRLPSAADGRSCGEPHWGLHPPARLHTPSSPRVYNNSLFGCSGSAVRAQPAISRHRWFF